MSPPSAPPASPASAVPAALLPAAFLLLLSGWAGTFAGGATGAGALAGHLAVTGVALLGAILGAQDPADPLGLGRRRRLLPALLLALLAVSWLASPVPRAGRTALLLFPAFLFLPAAVARCWSTPAGRLWGLRGVSAVVTAVAGASLYGVWRYGDPGASFPLGHHNLLAAWLLILLPLALLPWRQGGVGRVLALAAGVTGVAALAATRSLGAAVAAAAVATAWSRRGRWLLLVVLLLLVPQLPRLVDVAAGADPSFAARLGYWEAGWRGFLERPGVGWGPGAAAWTISEHLRPVPGIHPPGQVVADLHSLPLHLGYELGAAGVAALVAVAFLFVRRRLAEPASDPALRRAALGGLAAGAVFSVGGLPVAVAAIPAAAAVVTGAALAGGGVAQDRRRTPASRVAKGVVAAALGLLALLALPPDLAQRAYDRAATAADPEVQLRHLRRAVDLDPAFPLYRARLAWLEGEQRGIDRGLADRAVAAARDAPGVAPLWLVAGILAQETGAPGGREALLAACRLDPLGAVAPYRLATAAPVERNSEEWAGRALLAEPLLLAAPAWRERDAVLDAGVARVEATAGVNEGWRERLRLLHTRGLDRTGPTRALVLEMDGEDQASTSLHAFRRRRWPVRLARVDLAAAAVAEVDLVPAVGQPTTRAGVFEASECGVRSAYAER